MSHRTLSHRLRRPLVVWWALLVAVVGALAVPMAHAGPRTGGPGGLEVCSSTGVQTIAVDAGAGQEFIPYLAHCPVCLHSGDRLGPPPDRLGPLLPLAQGLLVPAARQALAVPLHLASVPPPRGPPCCS